jgi:stress response protein YsnF
MSINQNSDRTNHLQELGDSDFKIVEGQPNIKGWTVKDAGGQTIGEVHELLFDPESRKVRYIVLDLERNVLDLESRDVLVPIGVAELHEDDDDVILPNISAAQLAELPEYNKDSFSAENESRSAHVFSSLGAAAAGVSGVPYDQDHFNEDNLYKRRRGNSGRSKTVVGIFDNDHEAQNAVSELKSNGFSESQIDVSVKTNHGDSDDDSGISNFFSNMIDDNNQASHYTEVARKGSVVTVHAQSDEEARAAAQILDQHGSIDMDERYSQSQHSASNDERPIPVIEEQLHVGKKEVETGGMKLRSKIIERPVEEHIRLRSEKVTVQHHHVERPATEADLMKEQTIEETAHSEVPVINKDAKITEQVSLHKSIEENEETIHDSVRSTEVDIDQINSDEELRRRENRNDDI